MKLSPAGLAFLVREEGIRSQVYCDSTGRTITSYSDPSLKINGGKGYPTIGLGLALLTPELRVKYARYLGGGDKLTGAALATSIRETIEPRERQLNAMLKRTVPQSVFDSLFSWGFNRGFGNRRLKAAVALVNAGDMAGAAKAIVAAGADETVPHIVARRAREAALFLSGNAGTIAKLGASLWLVGGLALLGVLAAYVRRQHPKLAGAR